MATAKELTEKHKFGTLSGPDPLVSVAAARAENESSPEEWDTLIDDYQEAWLRQQWGSDAGMKAAAVLAPTLELRLKALHYLSKNEYAYREAIETLLKLDPQDNDAIVQSYLDNPSLSSGFGRLLSNDMAKATGTSDAVKHRLLERFGFKDYVIDTLAGNPSTSPDLLAEIADKALAHRDSYEPGRGWNALSHLARNPSLQPELAAKILQEAKRVNNNHTSYAVTELAKNPAVPQEIQLRAAWLRGVDHYTAKAHWEEHPAEADRAMIAKSLDRDFAREHVRDADLSPALRAILVRECLDYGDRDEAVLNDPDLQTPEALKIIAADKLYPQPMPDGIVKLMVQRLDPTNVDDASALLGQLSRTTRQYGQELSGDREYWNLVGQRLSQAGAIDTEVPRQGESGDTYPLRGILAGAAKFATHPESLRLPVGQRPSIDKALAENEATPPEVLHAVFQHAVAHPEDGTETGDAVLHNRNAPKALLAQVASDPTHPGAWLNTVAENPSTPVESLLKIARTAKAGPAILAYRNPTMPESERRAFLDSYVDRLQAAALAKDETAVSTLLSGDDNHIVTGLLTSYHGSRGDPDAGEEAQPPQSYIDADTLKHVYERLSNVQDPHHMLARAGTPIPLRGYEPLRRVIGHVHASEDMFLDYVDRIDRGGGTGYGQRLKNSEARLIIQHPNATLPVLKRLSDETVHGDRWVAQEAKDRYDRLAAELDPDLGFDEHVNVRFGTNKLRILRDKIGELGGDEAKPSQLPKELVQAIGSTGRLPNGNYSARLLQQAIDNLPATRLNISHSDWGGAQRHNDEPSQVLQVNATTAQVKAMKEAGVYQTYKKLCEFTSSAHPVRKDGGIGWIRYTGGKDGIHIDEIQSDMGQGFSRQFDSAVDAAVADGRMTKEEGARRKEQNARDYPADHLKKIEDILFKGKHSSEFLFEAFLEWARSQHKGKPVTSVTATCNNCGHHETAASSNTEDYYCPECGEEDWFTDERNIGGEEPRTESLVGVPVHVWDAEGKAPISGWDLSKPLPKHGLVGYREAPKKAGFKPSEYGSIPTQDNVDYKAVKGGIVPGTVDTGITCPKCSGLAVRGRDAQTVGQYKCRDCGKIYGVYDESINHIQPEEVATDVTFVPDKPGAPTWAEEIRKFEEEIGEPLLKTAEQLAQVEKMVDKYLSLQTPDERRNWLAHTISPEWGVATPDVKDAFLDILAERYDAAPKDPDTDEPEGPLDGGMKTVLGFIQKQDHPAVKAKMGNRIIRRATHSPILTGHVLDIGAFSDKGAKIALKTLDSTKAGDKVGAWRSILDVGRTRKLDPQLIEQGVQYLNKAYRGYPFMGYTALSPGENQVGSKDPVKLTPELAERYTREMASFVGKRIKNEGDAIQRLGGRFLKQQGHLLSNETLDRMVANANQTPMFWEMPEALATVGRTPEHIHGALQAAHENEQELSLVDEVLSRRVRDGHVPFKVGVDLLKWAKSADKYGKRYDHLTDLRRAVEDKVRYDGQDDLGMEAPHRLTPDDLDAALGLWPGMAEIWNHPNLDHVRGRKIVEQKLAQARKPGDLVQPLSPEEVHAYQFVHPDAIHGAGRPISGKGRFGVRSYRAGAGLTVQHGTQKLRKIRDMIAATGGDEVKPNQLPKPLVQALGNVGRLPNGNYSATKLQQFIDAIPGTQYNWSEGFWPGPQRHSNENSKVFQLNATTAQLDQVRQAGLLPVFRRLQEKFSKLHPVGPAGLGWVRWTGDRGGIHEDEVQSDYATSIVKRVEGQVARQIAAGKMDKHKGDQIIAQYKENFPDDQLDALRKILFGDRHASEVLRDAFHSYLRLPIHRQNEYARNPTHGLIDRATDDTTEGTLIGAPIQVWTPESKASISLEDVEGGAIPAHMQFGYGQLPKKQGYEPSVYGSIPTQDNVEHQVHMGLVPDGQGSGEDGPLPKELPAKPTWAEEVRKAEPKVWKAGDFKIPHHSHPSRAQFDSNYRAKLEDFFITPGFDQFVPRKVPVDKLLGSHEVTAQNNPTKTKLYTRMYAAGDPGLPIVVYPGTNGHYHIVDGNRRLLAAKAAGITHLNVLSKERLPKTRKSEALAKKEAAVKLPEHVQKAFKAVRNALSDDLRNPPYKGNANRYTGHCYVASEALYHKLGGSASGWVPQFIRWEGAPHWYLKHPATGTILDPTAEQFRKPVPYQEGTGKGFLTKEPSKRAQVLMDRVRDNL